MFPKHVLSFFLAVSFMCCLSSFNIKPAMADKKESSFVVVNLYRQFTVSSVNYNVYWDYDTASGTVSNVQVFLNDCTACLVTDVSSNATFAHVSQFNWVTTSGSLTVTTTCGTFVITGAVINQLPFC